MELGDPDKIWNQLDSMTSYDKLQRGLRMDLTQMEGHIFFSKDAPVFGISWEAKHTVVLIGLV